ncbi:ABC transporter transmembrane region domain-containing protein [Ditylenchus destructor]|uniref:ABC transporter transmembrane region domain-containing protein n=1 Tax=Ditylenchus destructor TaxID=166010 RepID=A0AAD4R0X2_9BILA|nr:ABC transporter transmembrane region domain-containing protein [Ditylenchus destructor]
MKSADNIPDSNDVFQSEPLLQDRVKSSFDENAKHRRHKEKPTKVPLLFLFRERTKLDSFLLCIGSAVAVLSGLSLPFLAVIMGSMTRSFVNASILLEAPNTTVNTSSGLRLFSDMYSINDFRASANIRVLQSVSIGVFLLFSSTIQVLCFLTVSENLVSRMRKRYFRSILNKEMAWHDKNPQSGTFPTVIFDDFERIKEGIGDKVALAIQYTSQFFGGFIIAFFYDWRLTLIMMSLMPLIACAGAFVGRLMSLSALREDKKYSKSMAILIEVLNTLPTVFAFNGQNGELSRYKSSLEVARFDCIMKSVYIGAGFAATFFVMFASLSLAFWIGTDFIVSGAMHPETLITVFFSVMMGSLALGRAGPQFTAVRTAQIAAVNFKECIDSEDNSKEQVCSINDNTLQSSSALAISFNNVDFAYPLRHNLTVLRNVSIDVKAGESVALVGPSGAGKSSVFALLLGLYTPLNGKITIEGTPLATMNYPQMRRKLFGYVGQEPVLFNTTIKENLKWACNSNVTDETIVAACKIAQIHNTIMQLPQGYDTIIGGSSTGITLSGGEKQRVAIARALLRNAPILLLDEATSALDSKNELLIQANAGFEGWAAGQKPTTIVIAHRLSTVSNVDRIFVMDNGQIVESGTHDELIAKKGVYFGMIENSRFIADAAKQQPNGVNINKSELAENNQNNSAINSAIKLECSDNGHQVRWNREKLEFKNECLLKDGRSSSNRETKYKTFSYRPNTEKARLLNELKETNAKPGTFLQILNEARPEWVFLLTGILFCLVQGCVFPIFSLFFTNIIETFTESSATEQQNQGHFWALMFLALGAIQAVCIFFQATLFGISSERFVRRLRVRLFSHILQMDLSFFDDPAHSPTKMCTRLATDTSNVKSTRYLKSKSRENVNEFEQIGTIALEAISNIRTVKSLALEEKLAELFDSSINTLLYRSRWKAFVQGLTYGFASSIYYFLYAASFYFAILLIMKGILLPMDVLRTLFAISFTAGTFGFAGSYFPELLKAKFAIGLIFKILHSRPKIFSDPYSKLPDDNSLCEPLSISVENVNFSYAQRREISILRDLTLKIDAGQTLGIVGLSGGGKSTLVRLLMRFYDPDGGSIKVNGIDLRKWDPIKLRSMIGWVDQEPTLFDRSIRENICYGLNKEASNEELTEVIKCANIDQLIMELPQGLDTRVGEKGSQLSAGQKQRVALARALIRNPKLLLLDEATSALDTENEKSIQQAIELSAHGRTCIIVAHRLSTLSNADLIAVLDAGSVVEIGKPSELYADGRLYRELAELQHVS